MNTLLEKLLPFREHISFDQIANLCKEKELLLRREQHIITNIEKLRSAVPSAPLPFDPSLATVTIGSGAKLSVEAQDLLSTIIRDLIPWRKGPFSIFGIEIDSEWRSDLKWERVVPHLQSLEGRIVADIGSNNGYYMFRMLEQKPKLVLGFEPSSRCYYSFELMQLFLQRKELLFSLLGVEHMNLFPNFFDTVFCMGILYHHRNPLNLLQGIRDSLKKGGQLIIESQVIPGDEIVALCPPDTYGKARNVYFVPTANCLASWLQKTGLRNIKICSVVETSFNEQRRTEFSRGESLKEFLCPEDFSRTIEGHPAPLRAILIAEKA